MSERNEPVDPRHEDALARALHAQAESVRPAGDGLIRIRARVDARSGRVRWIIPSAAVAAVAATVTAVVASGVLVGSSHNSQSTALPPASLAASSQRPARRPPTTRPRRDHGRERLPGHRVGAEHRRRPPPPRRRVTRGADHHDDRHRHVAPRRSGRHRCWPFAQHREAARLAADRGRPARDRGTSTPRARRCTSSTSLELPTMPCTPAPPPCRGHGTATVDVTRIEPTTRPKPVPLGTVARLSPLVARGRRPVGSRRA